MTTAQTQNLSDVSLLDLFRSEVETHAATIRNGLASLQHGPTSADLLEAMMRAAHSIKGGARIVELEAAEQIARVLETGFVTLQKGEISLQTEQLDVLIQGLNMLCQLASIASEQMPVWLSDHQTELTSIIAAMLQIFSPDMSVPATPPAHTTPTERTAPPLNAGQPNAPQQPSARPGPQPSADRPPAAGPEPMPTIKFSGGTTDESMLELFRTEVETHARVLTDGLLALEEHPNAKDHLEALMRAAHSIKGAARVVELDAVVQIAHVMEDSFVAVQKNELTLSSDHIDILLQGVDLLRQIGEATSDGAGPWLMQHQDEIYEILTAITAIRKRETSPPVSRKPSLQPSAPATLRASSPAPKAKTVHPPEREPTAPALAAKESGDEKLMAILAEERDRMIRVTAAKIERLMGLGGEVVVSARWLPQFSESLLALKKLHTDLFTALERLQEGLGETESQRVVRALAIKARETARECTLSLADRLNQLDVFTSNSANLSDRLYHEVISVRMRPFADGVQSLPRVVRDLAKKMEKKVKLEIIGKSTEVDRDILEKLDAPLNHLIRNAIDHGIELPAERLKSGKPEVGILRLEAVHRAGMLMILFSDDGQGIDLAKLRRKILERGLANETIVESLTEAELMEFMFLPGFSTADQITEISGRGVGLDVVHDMVHEVGGVIRAVSTPGKGTSFHLELPLTLSVIRTFLVEIARESYAFPLARIDRCVILTEADLDVVEDRQYFRFDNVNIALVDIRDVLDIEEPAAYPEGLPVVVISDRSHAYGLLVDRFIGECDLVVRPMDSRLGKVPDISAVAVMLDGSPVLIFDVDDMLRSVDKMLNVRRFRRVEKALAEQVAEMPKRRVLVVDDSITVREMERKLLENQGYQVEVAVDGMDAWNAVRTDMFDLVVTDIDMPRMNGIELVTQIKQHDDLKALPVIIISYKDTETHRLQGLEAGANYYLTKSSFQDDSFINAVVDLIGEAK